MKRGTDSVPGKLVTTCPTVESLACFLSGEHSERDRTDIEEHVEVCHDCQAALELLTSQSRPVVGMTPTASDLDTAELTRFKSSWKKLISDSRLSVSDDSLGGPQLNESDAFPLAHEHPATIASYQILGLLGRGGMGTVYLAHDTQLGRQVALKTISRNLVRDPSVTERFFREARAVAALKHPRIVTIHHIGESDHGPYLVLELLMGESLESRLRRESRLSFPEYQRITREIAEGLAATHAAGLIHRDIKPANVFLEASSTRARNEPSTVPSGDASDVTFGTVKLLDFGLARFGDVPTGSSEAKLLIGTPGFLAPEQIQRGEVSPQSDLFGLGCVLFQMLTGQLPFHGATSTALLLAATTATPVDPHTLRPEIPKQLADLIQRLLAKNPSDRPSSAQTVIDELTNIERELGVTLSSGSKRLRRARPLSVMLASVAGVVLSAALLWVTTNQATPVSDVPNQELPTSLDRQGQAIEKLLAAGVRVEVEWEDQSKKYIDNVSEVIGRKYSVSYLAFNEDVVNDENLHLLRGVESVRFLDLRTSNQTVTRTGTAAINTLKGIERLAFNGIPHLDDQALGELKNLTEVTNLVLWQNSVTDQGLIHLQHFPQLRELQLGGNPITGEGFMTLKPLPHLRSVALFGSKVNDEGLVHIPHLPQITEWILDSTPITDSGLKHLETAKHIRILSLAITSITDSGLKHLEFLSDLQQLNLDRTNTTAEGIQSLQTALPNCRIKVK